MDIALLYFDMEGKPMSLEEWARLYEDYDRRTVGRDQIDTPEGPRIVVTVWSGIREPEAGDDIFGTALLTAEGRFVAELGTYRTKQAALDGHRKAVEALRPVTGER